MKTTVLALLVAVGCGRPIVADPSKEVAAPAGADTAIATVAALYGMRHVPPVHWYAGQPECDGIGFLEYGECKSGVSSDDGEVVIVRYPPQGTTIGTDVDWYDPYDILIAILPHEFWHVESGQRGEGPDHDHRGHGFAPGGEVAQATALLVSIGL